MAAAKKEPARIAIIEHTPAGPRCRVTVPMAEAERVAHWLARITEFAAPNAVTTKMLAGSAA